MLKLSQIPKPLVLCILDGWGQAPPSKGNAISEANLQNFNKLLSSYPHTTLTTSGPSVGLPQGQVGNSEVGHLNLGAGRIVMQDLLRIDNAIMDGSFFKNEAFKAAILHIEATGGNIHLLGLVGSGSVHSSTSHLFALLNLVKQQKIESGRVKLHLFTDGRDCPPTSAKQEISQIQQKLQAEDFGQIASISGRYYAMDRDNRWDRTAKAYFALLGHSTNIKNDPVSAVQDSYAEGKTDEFIEPLVITSSEGKPVGAIKENDSAIFFNFRPDRARQLTKAFVLPTLEGQRAMSGDKVTTFDRGTKLSNLFFVSMTQYEKGLPVSAVAFLPKEVDMPLARVLSERGLRQLHLAETEKYAHVTYFFNGGNEEPFRGEERILVNSQKVASYDLVPQMSAPQITNKLISKITAKIFDFIIVNFANADMVSHTGNINATIEALKDIDIHLGQITKCLEDVGGGMIITADHGNAEQMINQFGQPDTEHNANPAPCIFVFNQFRNNDSLLPSGLLADVAPTILALLNIPKPSLMTGRNLLE